MCRTSIVASEKIAPQIRQLALSILGPMPILPPLRGDAAVVSASPCTASTCAIRAPMSLKCALHCGQASGGGRDDVVATADCRSRSLSPASLGRMRLAADSRSVMVGSRGRWGAQAAAGREAAAMAAGNFVGGARAAGATARGACCTSLAKKPALAGLP